MSKRNSMLEMSFPRLAKYSLIATFALVFASLLFASLVHRPMAQEGSWWYYEVLSTFRPMYDTLYFRHSDVLFQIPTLLWLQLFPSNISVGIRLLDLCYGLHPILSLVATVLILKQRNRLDLVFFPLLAFATSTLSTIGFGLGIVPGALSAFWPLFFLVLLRRPGSKTDLIAIAALSLFLGFSHEVAWLFFPVLAITQLWRWKKTTLATREEKLVLILILAFCGWYGLRLLLLALTPGFQSAPGSTARGWAWEGLRDALSVFRGFSLRVTLTLSACMMLATFFPKRQNWFRLLMAIGCLDSFHYFLKSDFLTTDVLLMSKLQRNSAVPMASIVALVTLTLSDRLNGKNWLQTPFGNAAQGWLVVVLLVCGLTDFRATLIWIDAARNVQALSQGESCQTIWDRQGHFYFNYSVRHFTSILLQESWKPKHVLFFEPPPQGPFPMFDTCRNFVASGPFGGIFHSSDKPFNIRASHFDYSDLTANLPSFYRNPLAHSVNKPQTNFLANLPAPTLWLKADTLKNTRNGSPVTAWNDSRVASSLVLTPPNSNSAPTYTNDAIGHSPAVHFNGKGQALVAEPVPGDRLFSSDQSTLVVVLKTSPQNAHPWFNWGGCNDNRFEARLSNVSEAKLHFSLGPRGSATLYGIAPLNWSIPKTKGFHIVASLRNKNLGYLAVNGSRISPASSLAGTLSMDSSATFTLGGNVCEKTTFEGEIAEVILFKEAVSTKQLKQIEGYLSEKYSIPLNQ